MQKLIIESGKKQYVDLTPAEIEEVNQRILKAQEDEQKLKDKQAAKREAIERLRGNPQFQDLILALGLDSSDTDTQAHGQSG